jgi:hypothetical protein
MAGIQQLLLAAKPAIVSDPNFEYTTLLLPGNGTNGAQNNTFLDSSTNNFTITRNGNTTQGTFSPFSQTGWGNFFNSGAIIRAGSSANLTLGSGSFTCECWVFPTAFTTTYAALWDFRSGANFQAAAPLIWIGTDGKVNYQNASIASSSSLALNQWTHVAVVRNGTTVTMYFNGTSVGSVTDSTTMTNTYCAIGAVNDTSTTYYLSGYVSNSRVVIGSAVYTANFTPPTAPLTAISGTAFLTCQSNRFVDSSANALAIAIGQSPSIQAFSPFNPTAAWIAATNGGSGYFDGSGDFLACPDNAALEPGSSDLTWEMWINTTSNTQYATLYSRTTASFASGMWSLMINLASSTAGDVALFVADFSAGAPLLQTTGVSVRDNAWHHIAIVRNGSAWTCYVDGVSRATGTWAGTIADIAGGPYVGADQFYGRNFFGYMSGLRIVKGTAVYTAGFTPPTAPPTAITNTSLLLNYTNAGIYDATSKNNLETVGNAQISTTQSKFGGSSMLFDGTGDWLKLSNNTAAQAQGFGTGDFTIECWVYITSSTVANNGIYDCRYSASATGPLIYYVPTSGLFMFYNGSNQISGGTITINTWNHIALVRYSGVTKLYINGTQSGSNYTDTNNYTSGANSGAVGAFYDGTSGWNGYIDDLRVTRGIARYTSNFTPPTTAFPLL